MRYLLLVCWDSERMTGEDEPEPGTASNEVEEGFPWVDDLASAGSGSPATSSPRRAVPARCVSAAARSW